MKRIQVYLGPADVRHLEAICEERGWTRSETVRVALRGLARHEGDALSAVSGMVRGLPPDLSERMDAYLEETFEADPLKARGKRSHRARSRR